MSTLGQLVTIAGGLVLVTGAVFAGWRKWLRGPWQAILRFVTRVDQTINGKPAELDAWGRETAAAIPPLAEQMTGIRSTVDALVEREARLTAIEQTVAEHGQRLTAIEAGHQIERSLGHVAQAKVFDAIGEVAKRRDTTVDDLDDGTDL